MSGCDARRFKQKKNTFSHIFTTTITCRIFHTEYLQTSTSNKLSGRLQPAVVSFICFCAHFVVLFIFANLNFRNVPYFFSFVSGAAEAMNQNEAISNGLDSVKRFGIARPRPVDSSHTVIDERVRCLFGRPDPQEMQRVSALLIVIPES